MLDRGLSPLALESLLVTAGEHIDLIKLGWGTAYVSGAVRGQGRDLPRRRRRDLPRRHAAGDRRPPGQLDRYVEWLRELGIDHVEVSNGSLPMARGRKAELIAQLAGEFTVIAEVGSKRDARTRSPRDWCAEMLCDLAAGAALVIAEGRESGTVGLFDATGEVHGELVDAILHARRSRDGDLRGAAALPAGVAAAPRRAERQPRQHQRRGRDRAGDAAARAALRHARPAASADRELTQARLGGG